MMEGSPPRGVVSVCEHNDFQLADRPAPEIGRDDIFADVQASRCGSAEGEHATSVDEHQFGIGETDQQAIALATSMA